MKKKCNSLFLELKKAPKNSKNTHCIFRAKCNTMRKTDFFGNVFCIFVSAFRSPLSSGNFLLHPTIFAQESTYKEVQIILKVSGTNSS